MAPKSQVMEGDVLATSRNGYAQVKMNDGSQMTMRPDSNLKIEVFKFNKDAQQADSAVFRLLRGGFRTVTGMIGKRGNQDAYALRAAGATIGIRGTDFTTRLCTGNDCQGGEAAKPKTPAAQAVGRVMLLQGSMVAKETTGNTRKLTLGSPVYEGDTLSTEAGTNSVVAFRDESRITLQENSSFYVENFKYDKAGTQESAVLRLLKGSVRVVTGLIGRFNHDKYKFAVANVATIGIRGTGFDAWCNGECASGGGNPGTTPDKPLGGAGVYVWSGGVVLTTPAGAFNVALQKAVFIAKDTGKVMSFVTVPKVILENSAPRPDSIPVDMDKEFESDADGAAGLYVTVHNGKIILTQNGKVLNLGTGESGFANRQDLLRLSNMPAFMGAPDQNSDPNPGVNPNGCTVQ
jgi:hypothetical protein